MNKTELLKIINKSSSGFSNVDLDIDKLETDLNWFYPLMKDLNSTYNGKPILHDSMKEQYKDTWEAYTKVRDAYGWTDSDVAYYVEFITNGAISDINDMPVELTEQLLDAIELDNEEGDE